MKFSSLTVANLAKAANPPVTSEPISTISEISSRQDLQNVGRGNSTDQQETVDFGIGGSANPANSAKPVDHDGTVSRISNFSRASDPQNVEIARVCCGNCQHSNLPPDTEPVYSWRRCGLGLLGNFARALHHCDAFSFVLHCGENPAELTEQVRSSVLEQHLNGAGARLSSQLFGQVTGYE